MEELFGVSINTIALYLSIAFGIVILTSVAIFLRNRIIAMMGIRNIGRRKSQTVLILLGLMLSTLIISAALGTGDTVAHSITNISYNQFRDVDVITTKVNKEDIQDIEKIDGVANIASYYVPVVHQAKQLSEPIVALSITETDSNQFPTIKTIDQEIITANDLQPLEAIVTTKLIEALDANIGDELTFTFNENIYNITIAYITTESVLASSSSEDNEYLQGRVIQIGGGIILSDNSYALFDPEDAKQFQLGTFGIISVDGGVNNNLEDIKEVGKQLEEKDVTVLFTKSELIEIANTVGSIFVTFFLAFGLFSIGAGLMLIFLTFIMLAAERNSEMGMARAIGMKRINLTESFIAEGIGYDLGSALIGAFLGLGVSYGLIQALSQAFSDFGVTLAFNMQPQSLIIAYTSGAVLTFITVVFASWRAANLNIVRAIRNIPEPQLFSESASSFKQLLFATIASCISILRFIPPIIGYFLVRLLRIDKFRKRYSSSVGWAVIGIIFGLYLIYWGGWSNNQLFAYTSGASIVLLALPIIGVYFGQSPARLYTLSSIVLLWFWLLPLPFNIFIEEANTWNDPINAFFNLFGLGHEQLDGSIEMFFVSGIFMTAASTMFIIFNADKIVGLIGLGGRWFKELVPALKIAVSFPLASKFRTGMTIAMFTLVVFGIVVTTILNANFTKLFLGGETSTGGFQVLVETPPGIKPINNLASTLQASGKVDITSITQFSRLDTWGINVEAQDHPDIEQVDGMIEGKLNISGANASFLTSNALNIKGMAEGYESAKDIFTALAVNTNYAVIGERVIEPRGPFGDPSADNIALPAYEELRNTSGWKPFTMIIEPRPPEYLDSAEEIENSGLTLTWPDQVEKTQITVIGIIDAASESFIADFGNMIVSDQTLRQIFDNRFDDGKQFFMKSTHYLQLEDSSDKNALSVAADIESSLFGTGIQATSIAKVQKDETSQSQSFQILFEAFMGLGLLVGIAALGVISFRAVVERRQQIGMLRAIGFTRKMTAIAFFVEASFIAFIGISLGIVLGVGLSYNLINSPDALGGGANEFEFYVPWLRVIWFLALAYIAVMLMTLIPAQKASKVAVAEALRYE
tara:strand:- start:2552 stop:5836 length:3285 start_codon:yes stop_codon:yes gene_type:complete